MPVNHLDTNNRHNHIHLLEAFCGSNDEKFSVTSISGLFLPIYAGKSYEHIKN